MVVSTAAYSADKSAAQLVVRMVASTVVLLVVSKVVHSAGEWAVSMVGSLVGLLADRKAVGLAVLWAVVKVGSLAVSKVVYSAETMVDLLVRLGLG